MKLEAAIIQYLSFCIYLIREILFLSGKSQGIFKSYACGNHGQVNSNWLGQPSVLSGIAL